jgi:hypothetical protein
MKWLPVDTRRPRLTTRRRWRDRLAPTLDPAPARTDLAPVEGQAGLAGPMSQSHFRKVERLIWCAQADYSRWGCSGPGSRDEMYQTDPAG